MHVCVCGEGRGHSVKGYLFFTRQSRKTVHMASSGKERAGGRKPYFMVNLLNVVDMVNN